MDKIIDKQAQRQKRIKKLRLPVLLAAILLLGIFLLPSLLRPKVLASSLVIDTVKRGRVEQTLSAEGTVEPLSELILVSPATAKIKNVRYEVGAVLAAGEPILELDTEFLAIEHQGLKDELQLKENNVKKLQLELNKNLEQLRLQNEIKDLELKTLQAAQQRMERLYEIGGATSEALDQSKQELAIAHLEKKRLESELNFKKASFGQDLANENILSSLQRQKLTELGKKLTDATISAQTPGVLTWIEKRIGVQVQQGEAVAKIADMSSYAIVARISDRFSDQIKVGMPVLVHLNNRQEQGRIGQIFPTIENSAVRFKVLLDSLPADVLKPNLSVPISVVTGQVENTLYLKDGAAFNGSKLQKLFVVVGNEAIAREVEIGVQDGNKVAIVNGLEEGDRVIISSMENYLQKTKIKIQ